AGLLRGQLAPESFQVGGVEESLPELAGEEVEYGLFGHGVPVAVGLAVGDVPPAQVEPLPLVDQPAGRAAAVCANHQPTQDEQPARDVGVVSVRLAKRRAWVRSNTSRLTSGSWLSGSTSQASAGFRRVRSCRAAGSNPPGP